MLAIPAYRYSKTVGTLPAISLSMHANENTVAASPKGIATVTARKADWSVRKAVIVAQIKREMAANASVQGIRHENLMLDVRELVSANKGY